MTILPLRYDGFPLITDSDMKLNYVQTIDAGLETIWTAFDNPDNVNRWQPNFESFTHKSRESGQPAFPSARYEPKYGATIVINHFEATDKVTIRWSSWCEFNFIGFMKFLTLFIAGFSRQRTRADMRRFRLMVETDEADRKR